VLHRVLRFDADGMLQTSDSVLFAGPVRSLVESDCVCLFVLRVTGKLCVDACQGQSHCARMMPEAVAHLEYRLSPARCILVAHCDLIFLLRHISRYAGSKVDC
jgi:hypothetical protein